MSLLWRRRRELHADQIRAIEGLDIDGRYLLLGPPGSGKTSILLHRGQYLRLAPHNMTNIRLVTFTRTLREFIAVSGDDRFPPGLVQTNKEFVDQIFRAYSAAPPTLPDTMLLAEKIAKEPSVHFSFWAMKALEYPSTRSSSMKYKICLPRKFSCLQNCRQG